MKQKKVTTVPVLSTVAIIIIGFLDVLISTEMFANVYTGLLSGIVGSKPYESAIVAGLIWLMLGCIVFAILCIGKMVGFSAKFWLISVSVTFGLIAIIFAVTSSRLVGLLILAVIAVVNGIIGAVTGNTKSQNAFIAKTGVNVGGFAKQAKKELAAAQAKKDRNEVIKGGVVGGVIGGVPGAVIGAVAKQTEVNSRNNANK